MSDVNWDAIGALSELLGAAGVIASLGYLTLQIQRNTNAMRGSAHESAVARQVAISLAVGSNADLAD